MKGFSFSNFIEERERANFIFKGLKLPAKGLPLNSLKFREFSEKGDGSSALLHICTMQRARLSKQCEMGSNSSRKGVSKGQSISL